MTVYHLGEFKCTKLSCLWKDFDNTTDWGYYDKSNGDCDMCERRCQDDLKCAAFECGSSYCSWWSAGTCDVMSNAKHISKTYETCRRIGSYLFSIGLFLLKSIIKCDAQNLAFCLII